LGLRRSRGVSPVDRDQWSRSGPAVDTEPAGQASPVDLLTSSSIASATLAEASA
jgi:hypothetical protein